MFRQEEVFLGGWHEKTIEAMQRRRFKTMVEQLPPLGGQRLQSLSHSALARRIEASWQNVERKPLLSQQLTMAKRSILESVERHADCLSRDEHDLLERALILGGCAQIEDIAELEAAKALSLRLWGCIGIISGKPYLELEREIMQPAAQAIARAEHERVRQRFEEFSAYLSEMLYRCGALDDRLPQQVILRDVLGGQRLTQNDRLLARRYLWSSCDCVDYGNGVMLLHPALAEPSRLIEHGRRKSGEIHQSSENLWLYADILPEEVPLQEALERSIADALRTGKKAQDVARDLRFLCKQGAPMDALEDVLQSSLIVLVTQPMREALNNMYVMTPKWIQCSEQGLLQ